MRMGTGVRKGIGTGIGTGIGMGMMERVVRVVRVGFYEAEREKEG